MSFRRFKSRVYEVKEDVPVIEPIVLDEDDAKKEEELTQAVLPEVETLSTKLKSVFGFKKAVSLAEHMTKIEGMTKRDLDEYAEQYEIYLDRRKTKENMINEFIQKLKEKN
jgi:hypothetical protein